MMYVESGQLIFSPSDLTQYMESSFASWMEHLVLVQPELLSEVDEEDAMMMLLQRKGSAYETDILSMFEAQGYHIVKLQRMADSISTTRLAMQSGVDIIYQAALMLPPFKGFADFLVKVQGESLLGNYHYEVWDTKLSKNVKPYFIIQLCCYAEILESIQGKRPENIVVVLGNGKQLRLRTDDYYFYYQNLKKKFIQAHSQFSFINRPDPSDSNSWGRWSNYAEKLFLEADHLHQVATITKSQIKKLNKAGIRTMHELASMEHIRIKGINSSVVERLKAQAIIQKDSIGQDVPSYKILRHEDGKKQGLALLPPESPLDIFFDIEGYPLEEGGLEYLWGITYFAEDGVRQFKDFWAHNPEQERESFKSFADWVYARWQQDPKMHIYHYASYEITACRKLIGRYGICEYEIDQLLRNEVFVDLYKIVKGGILLGEPRYSIKNVEHLYRGKRETDVGTGTDSIVAYEYWRDNPDGDTWQTSKILNDIRKYNMDDCNSTQELVAWLREKQKEQHISYLSNTKLIESEVKERITEGIQLRDRLLKKADKLKTKGDMQAASLCSTMAWSLEFHRREAKPVFWRLFDRLGLPTEELIDDLDCLANCIRTNKEAFKPTPRACNYAYEYSFDPNQEFKGNNDDYYVLGSQTADGKNTKVKFLKEYSDLGQGYISLQTQAQLDDQITLIPDEYVDAGLIAEAITQQAQAFEQGELEESAIVDFLKRNSPRIMGHQVGQPIAPSRDSKERLQQIIQSVINLNNSYLTIQGPPGAGKTYIGKHVIAELLKLGKKVGISSNSHKAINNLLISTAKYCREEGIIGYFACAKKTDQTLDELGVIELQNKNIACNMQTGCVIGTTAWGFARDDVAGAFDYLFIDEAGQVSVANLIAMSRATKNMILMGDQMQLGQPSQGIHPEDSGLSILDYLLYATATIPEHMGVFLGTTYRMHSAVNRFISKAIYEGKLESAPENDRQIIQIPEGYTGILNKEAGIVCVPVFHEGNTQASDEEVEQIVKLAKELRGRIAFAKDGSQKAIDWEDMLFVAPYNHQVNKLKVALGERAKVGSVDKFQGQEAPVVFLSMCASQANESPRGMNFLFDKNRLNVAISRAKSMAIVVYSPALIEASATNIEQLSMMNLFCRLVQTNLN